MTHRLSDAVCFDIELVVNDERSTQGLVVLREAGATRQIRLTIGVFEAWAMHQALCRIETPRPLTHEATVTIIRSLRAELIRVVVDAFELKTAAYHAKLVLRAPFREVVVDVRPSDALTLALHFGCPVFVLNDVLANVPHVLPHSGSQGSE